MLAANGALADLIAAGARILESGCGPCIGQGFSPADGVVSLRTFNRNFAGRSGVKNDLVHLVSPEVAGELSRVRAEGGRVIAVGTSTVRLLEEAARASASSPLEPFSGWVSLYILPGHRFRAVDAMITNFHLPRSTLLMLVSAFAGQELIADAYREAIARRYRFYSFGDAMLIL